MKLKYWNYILASIIVLGIIAGIPLYMGQRAEITTIAPGTNDETQASAGTSKEASTSSDKQEASTATDQVQTPASIDGKNLALNKTVTADGHTQSYDAVNTVDGDVITYWEGAPNAYPSKLTIDIGKAASIKTIRIKLNPDPQWAKRTQTFSISGSTDDTNYSKIVDSADYTFDPAASNTVTIVFTPVNTRYVRFEFTANTGATAGQAAEVEVY